MQTVRNAAFAGGRYVLQCPTPSSDLSAPAAACTGDSRIAIRPEISSVGDLCSGIAALIELETCFPMDVPLISRTPAMQYKATNKKLPGNTRELDVDAVVEGSVERVGDQVRITAQGYRVFPESLRS
jgi:adenylate cyclase